MNISNLVRFCRLLLVMVCTFLSWDQHSHFDKSVRYQILFRPLLNHILRTFQGDSLRSWHTWSRPSTLHRLLLERYIHVDRSMNSCCNLHAIYIDLNQTGCSDRFLLSRNCFCTRGWTHTDCHWVYQRSFDKGQEHICWVYHYSTPHFPRNS